MGQAHFLTFTLALKTEMGLGEGWSHGMDERQEGLHSGLLFVLSGLFWNKTYPTLQGWFPFEIPTWSVCRICNPSGNITMTFFLSEPIALALFASTYSGFHYEDFLTSLDFPSSFSIGGWMVLIYSPPQNIIPHTLVESPGLLSPHTLASIGTSSCLVELDHPLFFF